MATMMNQGLLDCLVSTLLPPEQATVTGGDLDPGAGLVVLELGHVVGQVGEVVTGLPRLLMAISAELARWQTTDTPGPAEEGSGPGQVAAVGLARLALAEATTAARVLARCVTDTAQAVATLTATNTGPAAHPHRSTVSA